MIISSVEQFINQVQDGWIGKNIVITKMPEQKDKPGENNPGAPQGVSGCHCAGHIIKADNTHAIELILDEVKVTPWEEMDRRIQGKYNRDSKFLVMVGKDAVGAGMANGALLRNIIIHVDGGTVFDVRDNRLVLLSDQEVVQFKAVH